MPMHLEGACRCGAVSFALQSHTPVPYQLCYCSICRKTAGGGGYAINIMGVADSLRIAGRDGIAVYRAEIRDEAGVSQTSSGERSFCSRCATPLWLWDSQWPELIHPFASVIDTALPKAPERVHLMLGGKANWVVPDIQPGDQGFDAYPEQSIEDWHRARGLWID